MCREKSTSKRVGPLGFKIDLKAHTKEFNLIKIILIDLKLKKQKSAQPYPFYYSLNLSSYQLFHYFFDFQLFIW